jgi:hypothetical protein
LPVVLRVPFSNVSDLGCHFVFLAKIQGSKLKPHDNRTRRITQFEYPKVLPNFLPLRDKWYCVELIVKANTPGKKDGEVKYWIDGKMAGDFPDLNMRSISTLKLDRANLTCLHANHTERVLTKWYGNVVIATQYIGPMTTAPSPTPTIQPTATPTLTPTASPFRRFRKLSRKQERVR